MRERPNRAAVLLVALLAILPCFAQDAGVCLDEAEYQEATDTILCDCGCHPQSVHACACGRAAEMRDEIRAEMLQGCLSAEVLIANYVERHGEQILIAPDATGFNLVAWLGPLAALAGASFFMLVVLRRWSRSRAAEAAATPVPAAPAPDERYTDRLRDALENME